MQQLFRLIVLLAIVTFMAPGVALYAQDTPQPIDPEAIFRAQYEAINARDLEGSLALIADTAVSIALPPPPETNGVFAGADAYRGLNAYLIDNNAVFEFIDIQVTGNLITFHALLTEDLFRTAGVFPIAFSGTAVVQDGLVVSETWIMNQESLARLDAALALESKKVVVRRFYDEIFSQGDMAVVDEIIAPDFIDHFSGQNGIDAFKATVTLFRTAFSDFKIDYRDMVAEGDTVVVNITSSGTYQGGLQDIFGIPDSAIGKQVVWHGTDYARIVDGKMVEGWGTHDNLDWFQQLDLKLVPPTLSSIETAPVSTLENNKAILRRAYEQIFTEGKLELLDEDIAPDAIDHGFPELRGVEAFKGPIAGLRAAFPDLQASPAFMIAEGDMVMALATFTGTHEAEFLGIPPTGKQITWYHVDINRIQDGKVVEAWHIGVPGAILQALGAPLTPPAD